MNLTKINTIGYRTIGIFFCVFLALGGLGMVEQRQFLKGFIGVIAMVLIIWLLYRTPTVKEWAVMIAVMLLSLMLIGAVDGYNNY